MPWSNQSGGGGGGGGPWGRGNGGGPWGGGSSGGGGGKPPDLEDLLRKSQDRLRGLMPGGSLGGKGIVAVLLALVLLWLATGFYIVAPNQVGINTVFGRYTGKSSEGLRYNYPYPVGFVHKPNVGQVNSIQVGYRVGAGPQGRTTDVPTESLMLTGDENIVDIDFDVQWRVNAAKAEDYIFNLQSPDGTIKAIAESAMREVIGRRNIQPVLTTEQGSVSQEVQDIMQHTLDSYGAGVQINVVQLQSVAPPPDVRQAFVDVNAAQQDAARAQNEAETYSSQRVPAARGEASRIVQGAEAYRDQATTEANGQAARFRQVYEAYKVAPDVSRERMYLETMERVLGSVNKIILDQNGAATGNAANVLPVLPLNEPSAAGRPAQGAVR